MNKFDIENLDLFYGENQALKSINLPIPTRQVTALIGPSGCGKSTLLRCLNRMNDLIEGVTIKGKLDMDGTNIYGDIDVADLRIRVGMVFQKPNPFPMSIYENVAYGLRAQGIKDNWCGIGTQCDLVLFVVRVWVRYALVHERRAKASIDRILPIVLNVIVFVVAVVVNWV